MTREFTENPTCSVKVNVYLNRDGNICGEGDTPVSEKTVTFQGIKSDITPAELENQDDSPALHNGISGLMWLFTGTDEGNFNPNVVKVSKAVLEEE